MAIDPLILLDTLEQYLDFLREIAPDVPGVDDILARYGPAFLAAQSEELHLRLLRQELRGGARCSAETRERLRRLTLLAGSPPSPLPRPARTMEARFAMLSARAPGGGWLYRSARAFVSASQRRRP